MKQVKFVWVEIQTPEEMSEYVNARLKELNYEILDVAITQIGSNFGYPHGLHFSAWYYFYHAIY